MRIAVDAMGGDHAPGAIVAGAFQTATEDGTRILLVGQRERLEMELEALGDAGDCIEIVHADEVVGMDEPATSPIRRKRHSSIRLCAELVKDGRAQALVTAGHTGAAMIAAKVVLGTITGVDRPALAAVVPNLGRGWTVVMDVGANVTAKAAHLRQFAVMGHFFAQELLGTEAPRVGLMSVGEEDMKGTDLTRQVFKVMQTTGLNFIGNIEGRDVFNGRADVVVCDGFVGNVLLKSAEALAELVASMLRQELARSVRARLGYLLARPALRNLQRRTNYEEYGAAPLLGVNGGCFIAHGRSNATAIKSSIRRAVEFCTAQLHLKIRDKVAELHAQEERLLGRADLGERSTP